MGAPSHRLRLELIVYQTEAAVYHSHSENARAQALRMIDINRVLDVSHDHPAVVETNDPRGGRHPCPRRGEDPRPR